MCGYVFEGCISTSRYTKTRGVSAPKAIVLRGISSSTDTYLTWIQGALLDPSHVTTEPKSVHYVVREDGSMVYTLNIWDTAKGLDSFDGNTWPLLAPGEGNSQFLFVGVPVNYASNVLSPLYAGVVEAVCCIIAEQLPTLEVDPLHILVDGSLSSQGSFLELPLNFIDEVKACLLARDITPIGTINDLFECCETNTDAIADLTVRVAALETTVSPLPAQIAANTASIAALQALVATLQSQVTTLISQVTSLQTGQSSIINTLLEHQACIDVVCPQPNSCLPIHYTLLPGEKTMVPYSVSTRVNFSHKVADTVPESVYTGPLWTASLACESQWAIQAAVNFDSTEWCAGGSAQLVITACGVDYIVHDYVIPVNGTQSIALSGSVVIGVPPTCGDVHVSVIVNDDTTAFKTVISGSVQMEPV